MKHIKLFGMNFVVDGKYLIGSSNDIDKLTLYILLIISLIFVAAFVTIFIISYINGTKDKMIYNISTRVKPELLL